MEEEGAGGWGPAHRAPRRSVSEGSLRSTPATPASDPQEAAATSLGDWARANCPLLLAAVWLAGMGVLAGRWLVRYVRFVRGLPRGRTAEEAWVRQWKELLAAEGVPRTIPLRVTATVGPMLCRLPSRWELLVPIDLWRSLTPERRLAVLRHELAHLKRHDTWKSLAARLLALPHWFNPAAWWVVRKFDEAAEWACDGAAAGADRQQAVGYARTLVQLGAPSTAYPVCGPAAQGRGLTVRVRRLLSAGTEEDSVMKRLLLITIALGLVVVCLLRFELVAKEAEPTSEATVTSAEADVVDTKASGRGHGPGAKEEISGLSVGGGPKTSQQAAGPGALSARKGAVAEPAAGGDYEELVEEADEAAVSPAPQKVPLKSLRYDGKSFEEWRREWTTELKPERRAEAVTAFAAFGANGYGEEAAEAILEVMRQLEISSDDAFFNEPAFNEGKLTGNKLIKHSAMAAFLPHGRDFRIPAQDAVKVLSKELRTGGRNGRLFAVFALGIMSYKAHDAIPALREAFQSDDDATVRCHAYVALVSLGPYVGPAAVGPPPQMPPPTLRELIKGAEPDALRALMTALVPYSGGPPGSVFEEEPAGKKRDSMGYATMYAGGALYGYEAESSPLRELRPGAEPIVEVLVEALESEEEATRREAIQALIRIGPKAKGVVPGLVRAFEKGRASDRQMILSALESFARVKQEPMPIQYVEAEVEAEYDLSAIRAEEVIPRLIQALDPGDPYDLSLMGRLYSRFGRAAEEVKPILQKAAQHEDEEVRRTAKAVLESISSREINR